MLRRRKMWLNSSKIKGLSGNLMLSAFAILVFLVFFEVLVRFFWVEVGLGHPREMYIPDDVRGYKYKPFFTGYFPDKRYADVEIRINSRGLRDYEHDYTKPPGRIRILGLGDSLAFGSGVDYEDTYLRLLEKKISGNGLDVEVVKAGVDGYDFDQEYAYYFEEGYRYDADIVLIEIVLNDAGIVNPVKEKKRFQRSFLRDNLKSARFLSSSLKNIRILAALGNRTYEEVYFNRIYRLWGGEPWNNYETKLLRLHENLTKEDRRLLLVVFPYTQQFKHSINYGRVPQDKIINISRQHNIPVLDLMPMLDKPGWEDYYLHQDDVHLNEKGYTLVAEKIHEKLVEEGFLA
jgi:lysophospholipase L1-like esterase